MTVEKSMARTIDHLVLPVDTLAIARRRLSALGFTVAPQGDHPFGTSNACVFLADGIYLEPLAIRDPALVAESMAVGNVFTGADALFRKAGGEGMSAFVTACDDAPAEHQRFVDAGVSAGEMLSFSRQAMTADGDSVTASFKLAFASAGSERFFLFSCQRINPLPADRAALERHDNAVVGLREIRLRGGRREEVLPLLELVLQVAPQADGDGWWFAAANGRVRWHAGGSDKTVASELEAEELVFQVADLTVTERFLAGNDLRHVREPRSIRVAPAQGQGIPFVFEE